MFRLSLYLFLTVVSINLYAADSLIILDSGGKFLGTYNTAKLEKDKSYSKSAFKLFIQQWQDS